MKYTLKTILLSASVLAAAGMTGCNDLDTAPQGKYVLTEQKAEAVSLRPELASAGVVGISSGYNQYMAVYSSAHCDFGWPAVLMMTESAGVDLVSLNIGYNWFSSAAGYDLGDNNNYVNSLAWYYSYKIIRACNDVLKSISLETEDPQLQLFAAQALANRANCYMTLAQLFQYTYAGHETLPCVPLITQDNADSVASEGCPRASVEEVYAQVTADLDKAIEFLANCGLSTSAIADSGAKRFISLGVAYGLRARANLIMNKWQAAASDADNAIATSKAIPASIAEASVPAFIDSNDKNWMWAVYVEETDRVVTSGIINFPSHMGSFNYGYAQVGAWRMINQDLFSQISEKDVRKGWFLDASAQSPNLNAQQAEYAAVYGIPPFTQVKFAPYNNSLGTSTNASDVPLMRVEEMYLIKAEAQAMGGSLADGKSTLENFVQTYRYPEFKSISTTAAEFQDEVWFQRRVELFGEGFSYFDLLRLNKPLDRRGGGWTAEWVYNVPAPLKPFLIPQREMEANSAITSNNDSWSKPNAVDDL